MIYRERDSILRRRRRVFNVLVIFLILIFVIGANFLFPNFFSPITHFLGLPVVKSRNTIGEGSSNLFDLLHSKMQLVLDNRDLREKLALTDAITAERDELKQENETLRTLLGQASTTPEHRILAQVISKPGFSPYDTIIVDAGSAEHIKVGDVVYVDQSVLIGEVATVTNNSSNIILYSSPGQKNTVLVGKSALEATAEGAGGGVFVIRLPQNSDVHEGDIVTFSKIPQAVFGTVSNINIVPSDSFERIFFRSPVNISELNYVTISSAPQTYATTTNRH